MKSRVRGGAQRDPQEGRLHRRRARADEAVPGRRRRRWLRRRRRWWRWRRWRRRRSAARAGEETSRGFQLFDQRFTEASRSSAWSTSRRPTSWDTPRRAAAASSAAAGPSRPSRSTPSGASPSTSTPASTSPSWARPARARAPCSTCSAASTAPPAASTILGGRDVSRLDDDELSEVRSRYLGFIFQSYNLIAAVHRAREHPAPADLPGERRDQPRRPTSGSVELAGLVGLGDRLDHRPDPALRRPAAARGHRPLADQRSLHHPGRRGDRKPRHGDQP